MVAPRQVEEQLVDTIDSRAELARHRRARWRGRLPLALALATLLGFALVLLFVLLGDAAALDRRVTLAVQGVAPPGLLALMVAVSWPGFGLQSPLIILGVAAFLFWRRLRIEGAFALLAAGGAGLLDALLKGLVRRPRPAAALDGVIVHPGASGNSFPSGHVLTYLVFCGFLAYLAYTLMRRAALRRALLALLLGLIALVGPSRVYLGQHWFTDTIASYLLGTALLVVLLVAYRRVKAWQLARAAGTEGVGHGAWGG